MSYIRLISFLANHLAVYSCEINNSNATASMKPAQYETKHNATRGRAAYSSSRAATVCLELIVETRQQHVSLPKKRLQMLKNRTLSRHINNQQFSPLRCRVR
ncbi:hypothetical protein GOODEAATRI_014014 [Goodea atripinnis]|uniref:Secreted protein n=1 Tax=Goodea atripinnis TaxID=208336 RepID=A0ABV0P580_9TELE